MPVEEMIEDVQVQDAPLADDAQQQADPAPQIDAPVAAQTGGDERLLPRWIRDLKGTRAQDFTAAKDSFFAQKALSEKVKDRDLDKVFAYLDENGGIDGLNTSRQSLQERADEYDGLLQAVQSGDGSIADRIFETAGAKSGDIARAVMNKYSASDPEGWSDSLMPIFASTLANGQVVGFDGKTPTTLTNMLNEARYMSQYAPAEQQQQIAQAVIERVAGFVSGFTNAQPRATNAQNSPQVNALADRERQIDEREKAQYLGTVSQSLREEMQKDIEAQLKTYFDRRPDDKDARAMAIRDVTRELNERLSKDADFNKKWDAYIAKKDTANALKLASSRRGQILGEIAARTGRTIFGNPAPKPTPAPKQTAAPVQRTSSRPMSKFDEVWASR